MSETLEPDFTEEFIALAKKVRQASRAGKVLQCREVWQRTPAEFLGLSKAREEAGVQDVVLLQQDERMYFYSEQLMTRSYAEAAARVCGADTHLIIAETVRNDSRTYPRPTPIAVFREAPFLFSQDVISQAIEEMSGDPKYPDICLLCASDGSRFLFSANHLDPSHAESLAEWIAVGHLQNP
jgi:hypothetical protein